MVRFHNLIMVHWLMWKSCAPCDIVSLWLIMESYEEPCDIVSLWLIMKSHGESCDIVSLWLIVESHVHHVILFPCDLLWNHMGKHVILFSFDYLGNLVVDRLSKVSWLVSFWLVYKEVFVTLRKHLHLLQICCKNAKFVGIELWRHLSFWFRMVFGVVCV
jgi:hypothetical protein